MSEGTKRAKVYYSIFHRRGCTFERVTAHGSFDCIKVIQPSGEYLFFALGWRSPAIERFIEERWPYE